MRVAVIGASGWLGGCATRELLARGHEVTAIGRDESRLRDIEGAAVAVADVTDPESITRAVTGHDAVVAAVTDRTSGDRSIIPRTARTLLEAVPPSGVRRVVVVGGGGSLEVEPGVRAIDQPGFPEQYRAEAEAQAEALAIWRGADTELDWSYLSPPPHHLEPGEKTGSYLVRGGDMPVTNEAGDSRISAGDFASALVDELESPHFVRQRFTAGS